MRNVDFSEREKALEDFNRLMEDMLVRFESTKRYDEITPEDLLRQARELSRVYFKARPYLEVPVCVNTEKMICCMFIASTKSK